MDKKDDEFGDSPKICFETLKEEILIEDIKKSKASEEVETKCVEDNGSCEMCGS